MPALLSRKPQKPKALLLGISYPSVEDQMEKHGFDPSILTLQEPSVDQAVECVRRGIFTEMDARDLARCVATEQAGDMDVYTVSKEIGAEYRSDRHIHANFNARQFCKKLQQSFGENIQFSQVILDYYWMPTGWLVTRWAKTLFSQTLPDLVRYNMLTYPSKRRKTRKGDLEVGVVYLPFCAHVTKEIVGAMDVLKDYYQVSFVKKQDLPGHCLWKGTMAIEADTMQHRLGKRLDQEEVYCTFKPKDIYENMEDSHVSKPQVMRILNAIVDYADVRMIMFRPLRQHEPPSVMKERLVTPEKGGFIGLDFTLPPHNKRNKKEVNEATPPDTPESAASATPASPEPKGSVLSKKKKGPVVSKEKLPVSLSKEKGPVYEDVEEKPIPTKPMEYADLTYYYSGPAPDLDAYFYKDKVDMKPEEEEPEEKPAPTPPKKPKPKPPVEDIWAVYNRLVHRKARTTRRSLLAKKDLIVPDFDAAGVVVKRETKKTVVTDIEEVVPVPVVEEPQVVKEQRKEETTFLKNRWYKEVSNEVDEKETPAEVVLKLPGKEEQEKLFHQTRHWEQEENELFKQNGLLDGARALFDINNRKKLKRIALKSYGKQRRKEIVVYKIPKQTVLELQEKNGQEMWPLETDLFEPFQKAIECTRDFRGPRWARFWDEKVREAYLAQREALFRETVERSEYNPHALSVAEKRVKSMDTILEWLVSEHDSSLDPDGEITAVYARLKKKQLQTSIPTLTKTIEKSLLKRKEDSYLEVAKAELKAAEAEAEQKVLEAETVQLTHSADAANADAVELAIRLYTGADAHTKEMVATDQTAAEFEQSAYTAVDDEQIAGGVEENPESISTEAKPEQKAAETEQIAAERLAILLATSAAQLSQLAAREMEETNEDDDGRNLKEDIADWLLNPQDAKDSTGEFRMMGSRFPAKENQDPSERASDMASKIRFLRNAYPDWVASMKAQDEDIMRRSLATELGKERGATVFACFKWLRDADPKVDPSGELAFFDARLLDKGRSLEHRARSIGTMLSDSYSTCGPSMLAKTMTIEERESDQLCCLYAQYGAERSMRLRRIYCWLGNCCFENDPSGEIAMLYSLLKFKPDALLADMARVIEEDMDQLEARLGSDWINELLTVTTLCSKKNTGVNAETATSKSKKAPTKKSARKGGKTSTSKKAPTRKRASTKNEKARAIKMAGTSELESWTSEASEGAPSTKKPPTTRKMADTRQLESTASKGVPPSMEAPTSAKVPSSQEDAANAKASTSKKASRRKKAPTSKKVRTSEEAPTSSKPENDGNDGTRGQSAKPNINTGKSCKRSRGHGQDSKKPKKNRRSAVEITPEGSADGDQVRSRPNPPVGVAPVSLANDNRFYGPLALAGQHAGMLQRQMPAYQEVLLQRQMPAYQEVLLQRQMPAYQEGYVQLNSGGRSMWLTGDRVQGGRVEWRVSPEEPLYNSPPPSRSRIDGGHWPYRY